LLPLMTAWITDIKANLMTQLVLRALFASLSPILCILVMKPRAPFAMTFGFILMLLLVCLRPPAIWNYWVDSQPYGTSAALLVAAIAVLSDVHNLAPLQRATRQTIAFAILLLATWVNLSLFLVAGPLFVLLALTLRSSQFATLAVLSLVAYALISHAALIGDVSMLTLPPVCTSRCHAPCYQFFGLAPSWSYLAPRQWSACLCYSAVESLHETHILGSL
jgi:hypothetical protein